jgi:elongation factor 1-gamma
MPSYTLHAPAGSFRAFSALIAAEYNGIDVQVAEFDGAAVAALSPTGKAPVLVLPSGQTLFSSHAIARYIAGIRRDSGLTGSSLMEQGSVDAWMDFCSSELELPACVWYYPAAGYMPFNKDA